MTQVIAAEGGGQWREFIGGYSDWAAWHGDQQKIAATRTAPKPAPQAVRQSSAAPASGSRATKLSYKEQQELNALPERIEALETEQAALIEKVNDPTTYASDAAAAQTMAARLAEIEDTLLALLERWEALEAKTSGR